MARKTRKAKRVLLAGVALELFTIVGLIALAQPEQIANAVAQIDSLVGRTPATALPAATPAVGHIHDLPHRTDLVLPPVLDRREWLPGYFDMAVVR